MKVWVYVEGEGDRLALEELWKDWREKLGAAGYGVHIIALGGKNKLLSKIGQRAAEKLAGNQDDLVVGLPDLYPNSGFETPYAHNDFCALQRVQKKQVKTALRDTQDIAEKQASSMLDRFYPSALKHDLEMLLLAATAQLKRTLGTNDKLGNWRVPVEDQNQGRPPKRVVEELFLTKSRKKQAYRDTKDAPAVLRKVDNIRDLLYTNGKQLNCPMFKEVLDWISKRTGVPY